MLRLEQNFQQRHKLVSETPREQIRRQIRSSQFWPMQSAIMVDSSPKNVTAWRRFRATTTTVTGIVNIYRPSKPTPWNDTNSKATCSTHKYATNPKPIQKDIRINGSLCCHGQEEGCFQRSEAIQKMRKTSSICSESRFVYKQCQIGTEQDAANEETLPRNRSRYYADCREAHKPIGKHVSHAHSMPTNRAIGNRTCNNTNYLQAS